MVWKNVHCRTCGQDLPEPQARLAMAELDDAETQAQLERQRAEAEKAMQRALEEERQRAEERRRLREHLQHTREAIRDRWRDIDVDAVWALRAIDLDVMNRRRLSQFHKRAKLYGLTIPMAKRPPADILHHPV